MPVFKGAAVTEPPGTLQVVTACGARALWGALQGRPEVSEGAGPGLGTGYLLPSCINPSAWCLRLACLWVGSANIFETLLLPRV